MGNLQKSEFDQVWNSKKAMEIRRKVVECQRNCWMVGTAVPAMRKKPWTPLLWITKNKLHLARHQAICLT
jgi:hypothetical protein